MRQDDFLARYEPEWRLLELWLDQRARPKAKDRFQAGLEGLDDIDFAARYRRACQQLAIAQRRGYSPLVLQRLEHLVQRGHDVLYRPPTLRLRRIVTFFASDFPRLIRRHRKFVALSTLLFFVPLVAMIVLLQYYPELAHSMFSPKELAQLERMYDPSSRQHAIGRESGTNL